MRLLLHKVYDQGHFPHLQPVHIVYTCDASPLPRASFSGLLASLLVDAMSASAANHHPHFLYILPYLPIHICDRLHFSM